MLQLCRGQRPSAVDAHRIQLPVEGRWRRRLINEALRPPKATADWLAQIEALRAEGEASGVDPIAVADVQQIVSNLRDAGLGILITDHNVRETLSVTDRAYIIAEGRIIFAGTPRELGNNPEVRRLYLGEGFSMA